jgi:anti-sigma-K factor RskA
MTERKKSDFDKLARLWTAAHRSRPVPSLGDDWTNRLMGRIRRESGHRSLRAPTWIDQFVWRTAAVAAAFALIFSGSALLYTEQHKGEVVSLLSEEFDAGPVPAE